MLNPEYARHPCYTVTDEIRGKYPNESKRWEELLKNAKNPKDKGCFACRFYKPPNNEFADVEFIDKGEKYPILGILKQRTYVVACSKMNKQR